MPTNISHFSVLLEAITIVVLACVLIKIIEGQNEDWPIVIDPFPDADIIGPEPAPTPPPAPDCTRACQDRIDEAWDYIRAIERQLLDANSSLVLRILNLERANNGGGGGGNSAEVLQRLNTIERNLVSNVTMLTNKINTDVSNVRQTLSDDISYTRRDLEDKINRLPTGGGGGDGGLKAMEVYHNLTSRINGLENGKIQNLVNDNNLWRQNFRVVNATFSKLKKSNTGNNIILTG